jgi:Protein of unknown function (DUF4199)
MAVKKISIALLFGLIAAGSMILFIMATYLAGPKAFAGGIAFLGYVIIIALGAAAALVQKRANGGWLPFQDAVKVCFTVFVLGLAARTLFPWLLVNVIDPHFRQLVKPEMIANAERSYRSLGVPEDTIRQQIEAVKNEDPFPLGSMLLLLAITYIIYFFIALLIAAIVKRKKEQ